MSCSKIVTVHSSGEVSVNLYKLLQSKVGRDSLTQISKLRNYYERNRYEGK